ncbi:MAG: hypothetical protein K2Q09_01900 [Phycisphaerales bacterium]|nr:hypothetical protein [Phycisphaerales bacterium]
MLEDLSGSGFDQTANGCSIKIGLCTVSGPIGIANIVCVLLKPADAAATQIYPILRAPASDSSTFENAEGTKLIVTSAPQSVRNHTFDGARDRSSPCNNLPEVDRCICTAQRAYDDCFSSASAAWAACNIIAAITVEAAFAKRVAPLVTVPGFNIFVTRGCATSALYIFLGGQTACAASYLIQLRGCQNSLFAALESCGWHWAQT